MRSRSDFVAMDDASAQVYASRVLDEVPLVRRGYAACLRALAEDLIRANPSPDLPIVELGVGTGRFIEGLPRNWPVVAVDHAPSMIAAASANLAAWNVTYVLADILAWVTEEEGNLGHVVLGFSLHRFALDEQSALWSALSRRMAPNARLLVADVGFVDEAAKAQFFAAGGGEGLHAGDENLFVGSALRVVLEAHGWRVRLRSHGPMVVSLVATRDTVA